MIFHKTTLDDKSSFTQSTVYALGAILAAAAVRLIATEDDEPATVLDEEPLSS